MCARTSVCVCVRVCVRAHVRACARWCPCWWDAGAVHLPGMPWRSIFISTCVLSRSTQAAVARSLRFQKSWGPHLWPGCCIRTVELASLWPSGTHRNRSERQDETDGEERQELRGKEERTLKNAHSADSAGQNIPAPLSGAHKVDVPQNAGHKQWPGAAFSDKGSPANVHCHWRGPFCALAEFRALCMPCPSAGCCLSVDIPMAWQLRRNSTGQADGRGGTCHLSHPSLGHVLFAFGDWGGGGVLRLMWSF